jgi:hypothetical protein
MAAQLPDFEEIDIGRVFGYRVPTNTEVEIIKRVSHSLREVAHTISMTVPKSPERMIALRHLQYARGMVIAAIVLSGTGDWD